ncbi:hypothetical protein CXB51_016015 [Gossypium anomalum]|uniref:Uncharacterized protein n=1 Tax=Gossypium anomalum TaxID=47600 RepID=A0A8J6D0J6_9ROSI|nr:hypothetical protein CXB51_016015 [Gossypium anomalum]
MVRFACYTSQFEPKHVEEALKDAEWIQAIQVEGFDFYETFSLVARLEAIKMLFVVATHLDILASNCFKWMSKVSS